MALAISNYKTQKKVIDDGLGQFCSLVITNICDSSDYEEVKRLSENLPEGLKLIDRDTLKYSAALFIPHLREDIVRDNNLNSGKLEKLGNFKNNLMQHGLKSKDAFHVIRELLNNSPDFLSNLSSSKFGNFTDDKKAAIKEIVETTIQNDPDFLKVGKTAYLG